MSLGMWSIVGKETVYLPWYGLYHEWFVVPDWLYWYGFGFVIYCGEGNSRITLTWAWICDLLWGRKQFECPNMGLVMWSILGKEIVECPNMGLVMWSIVGKQRVWLPWHEFGYVIYCGEGNILSALIWVWLCDLLWGRKESDYPDIGFDLWSIVKKETICYPNMDLIIWSIVGKETIFFTQICGWLCVLLWGRK